MRRGKNPRRWKSRRAGPQALCYMGRHGKSVAQVLRGFAGAGNAKAHGEEKARGTFKEMALRTRASPPGYPA